MKIIIEGTPDELSALYEKIESCGKQDSVNQVINYLIEELQTEGTDVDAGRQFKDFLAGRLNMLDLVISDMRQSLLEKGGHERLENQGDKT